MASYVKARKKIINYIKKNGLNVGDKLPSEAVLSKELSISRLTLRESINVLQGEGFVYTIHGKGSFISSDLKHISDTLNNNLGITEMIELAGSKPGTKDFERILVTANKEVANNLRIEEGTDVLVCKRIRTADGKPVVYSIDYFAPRLVSGFLNIKDKNVSIYKFIEEDNRLKIDNSIVEIIPYKCTSDLARMLDYKKDEPLLKLIQTITDEKGNPLIYAIEYLRPDCFKILISRKRKV